MTKGTNTPRVDAAPQRSAEAPAAPFAALLGEASSVRAESFDGTPIYAEAYGTPYAPVVLAANGVGARMDAFMPVCEPFFDRFRFITWDYRGLYESARPLSGYAALSIADHARDAQFLLDAIGVPQVHLMGWSLGVQVALEMYRTCASRIASMTFVCGVPGRPLQSAFASSLLPEALTRHVSPAWVDQMQRFDGVSWRLLQTLSASPWLIPTFIRAGFLHHDVDRTRFLFAVRQLMQLDMHVYLELLRQGDTHDASDVLPSVTCPSLVVAGTKDVLTPFARQQEMAQRMPNATLCAVFGGTHFAPLEQAAPIVRALSDHFAHKATTAATPAARVSPVHP